MKKLPSGKSRTIIDLLPELLCKAEGGKEQVNIAQMEEIVKVFPEVAQAEFHPLEVLKWLYGRRLQIHVHIGKTEE